MAAQDPLRLIDDFDAAWNSHDEEAVLNLFTEDALARVVPAPRGEPEAYEGRDEIREFVGRHLAGLRVESRDHQVAGHQDEVADR